MSKPTIKQIKSIFGKKAIAEEYLKETYPKYFGFPTTASKKIQFLSKDLDEWSCIQSHWDPPHVLQWTRNYAISSKGKYHLHHKDPHSSANLLQLIENKIQKLNSLLPKPVKINPETFSNEYIKPFARRQIDHLLQYGQDNPELSENYPIICLIALEAQKLRQLKNDCAEYNLLQSITNLFPTLSHKAGADLWILENNELVPLDIKNSRWPGFFYNGITHQDAAKLLYEEQGGSWFSAEPRTYLISSSDDPKELPAKSSILPVEQQLQRTFSVSFTANRGKKDAVKKYGTDTFTVDGVRVVFL